MKTAAIEPDEERATERMSMRVRPRIKQTIRRAAALRGVDESAFTLDAAYQAALETIAVYDRMTLQPSDYEAFFTALDNPPEPTPEAISAMREYRRKFVSE